MPTEIEDYPFHCPNCDSRNVSYLQDAAVWFEQRDEGAQVVREASDPPNLYDTVLSIVCRNCKHEEEHPGRGWN